MAGKPRLGQALRFEARAEAGRSVFLLFDAVPGPVTVGGVTFGVGLSPALVVVPLGPSSGLPLVFQPVVPVLAALEGATFYVEAVTEAIEVSGAEAVTLAAPLPLGLVDDFTYQLQGPGGADLSLTPIAQTKFDLCIVDFSRDGLAEFTPAEVAALRSPAEPDRIRLAYMSIGEAEDYRWYWPLIDPSLVAGSNPNWPGNYKVEFWRPEWKEVIVTGGPTVGKSYLDRIIDQGFDGVYLDVVDAFEFFGPASEGGTDWKRDAAARMVDFILEIAHHARVARGRPDFLVVPQNGANLFDPVWYPADTLGPGDPPTPQAMADFERERLLATVDAIGVEDVFYGGPKAEDNAYSPDTYILSQLALWQAGGARVFSVEYLTKQGKIDAFYDTHAPAHGFVPYATVRDLDQLTINPGHEPD